MFKGALVGAFAGLAIGCVTAAVWAQVVLPRGTELESQGRWQREGAVSAPHQRWRVRLRRLADNSIVGTVNVEGSPLVRHGRVEARVLGTAVSGRILDERGEFVANITGEVHPDGSMHGVYIDRTGEKGEWKWDSGGGVAAVPEQQEQAP